MPRWRVFSNDPIENFIGWTRFMGTRKSWVREKAAISRYLGAPINDASTAISRSARYDGVYPGRGTVCAALSLTSVPAARVAHIDHAVCWIGECRLMCPRAPCMAAIARITRRQTSFDFARSIRDRSEPTVLQVAHLGPRLVPPFGGNPAWLCMKKPSQNKLGP